MRRSHATRLHLTAALAAAALAMGACSQMDEVLNNEEMKEYQRQGQAAGAGLKIDEAQKKAQAPKEDPKLKDPFGPSGKGEVYDTVFKRTKCGMNTRCTEETTEVLTRLGPQAAEDLSKMLGEDHPLDVRIEAARILGWLQATKGVDPLLELLKDPLIRMRKETVWALGQIGDAKALPRFEEILGEKIRNDYREAVIQALGSFRHPDAIRLLTEQYQRKDMRAGVVSALGRTRQINAVEPLITALTDDDPLVQIEAVNALGNIDDQRAIKALEGLLRNPSVDKGVRDRAKDVIRSHQPDDDDDE